MAVCGGREGRGARRGRGAARARSDVPGAKRSQMDSRCRTYGASAVSQLPLASVCGTCARAQVEPGCRAGLRGALDLLCRPAALACMAGLHCWPALPPRLAALLCCRASPSYFAALLGLGLHCGPTAPPEP